MCLGEVAREILVMANVLDGPRGPAEVERLVRERQVLRVTFDEFDVEALGCDVLYSELPLYTARKQYFPAPVGVIEPDEAVAVYVDALLSAVSAASSVTGVPAVVQGTCALVGSVGPHR